MIRLEIPGWGIHDLENLFLDLNGTVALDGQPIPGVGDRVDALSRHLAIYLVTADTHGKAEEVSQELGVQLVRITPNLEASQKRALVHRMGREQVVAIGNGANDAQMLQTAALGIAVLGHEGLAVDALQAADVVVGSIEDGLDLLRYPRRIVATLRC